MAKRRTPRVELPEVLREQVAQWRRDHPQATFAEMEEGVQELLDGWRPRLLEELAGASIQEPQLCARCGERMQRRGTRKREVVTAADGVAELERPSWTCPRCQLGLFLHGLPAGSAAWSLGTTAGRTDRVAGELVAL